MLFLSNTNGRNRATIIVYLHLGVIILALTVQLLFTSSVAAIQTPSSATTPENTGNAIDTDNPYLPGASDVVDAYIKLRKWTDNFSIPSADDPDAQITLQGAQGICGQ